ncbi:MAG: Signal transduction protein [uncultured Thiotrichaceae bacterium]|uniref:Signal transduction protein n=1 Tax=uncultured Thiotrichaceae bacterium TaxID=298394 RepID=A0A6S6TWG3_9GAMM|nr:MAG: Signal transduction protein [uncultured Thiotrichaceae bacterium]
MPVSPLQVRNYMSTRFATLSERQDISEAITLFTERDLFGAAVLDNLGNMVGVLSVTDCIGEAIREGFDAGSHRKVSALMSKDVRTVDADDNILDVAKLFMEGYYRRYPVMEDNRVVGVITRLEVLKGISKIGRAGVAI